MKKLITALAALYALAGPIDAQTIKTETEYLNNPLRQGFSLQRTELDIGNFVAKHDLRENLAGMQGATDVAILMQKKIIPDTNYASSLAILNLGNFDGKDETFLDAYFGTKDGNLGLELGTGARKAAEPRHFFIATAKNFSITDKLSTSTEFGFLSKDPLQENKDRWYGYTALFTKEAFAALGNEVNATHVITGLNLDNVGDFSWYRHDRQTGIWHLKTRLAVGNIDRSYYNSDFQQVASYIVTIPSFFATHFSPVWGRGDETFGANIAGDNQSTTAMAGLGVKTPVGYIAAGTDTKFVNNESSTGAYLGYYNNFSVLGIKGSVEINYSGRTHQADAYVKMNKPL